MPLCVRLGVRETEKDTRSAESSRRKGAEIGSEKGIFAHFLSFLQIQNVLS